MNQKLQLEKPVVVFTYHLLQNPRITMISEDLCDNIGLQLTPAIEKRIKKVMLDINLDDTLSIGHYGAPSKASIYHAGHEYNEAVSDVSKSITGIVESLKKADPRMALKKKRTGFFSRLVGNDSLEKVTYVETTNNIDTALLAVPAKIQHLEDLIKELDRGQIDLIAEQEALKVHIVAGHGFLEKNPEHGNNGENAYGLASPRNRFVKRLQNLAALLASNDATIQQILLLKANSVNIIDRLHEVTTVLVPSWRSHRLALYVNDQDYSAVNQATTAHDALLSSLQAIK